MFYRFLQELLPFNTDKCLFQVKRNENNIFYSYSVQYLLWIFYLLRFLTRFKYLQILRKLYTQIICTFCWSCIEREPICAIINVKKCIILESNRECENGLLTLIIKNEYKMYLTSVKHTQMMPFWYRHHSIEKEHLLYKKI
jgi:hypothetical protein